MSYKYNTLNEEVNRIKSMFTEERLYGNLVNNTILLTEQEQLFKMLLKLIKPGKSYRLGDDVYKLTINKRGEILAQKNNGSIKKPNWGTPQKLGFSDFISKSVKNTVRNNVSSLKNIDDANKYFDGGYAEDLKLILKDVETAVGGFGNLNIDSYVDDIMRIMGTGANNKINNVLLDKSIWEGSLDLQTFKKQLKSKLGNDVYELIDIVPGLDENLYKSYSKIIDDIGIDKALKPKVIFKGQQNLAKTYQMLLDNKRFKDRLFGKLKPKQLLKIKPPSRVWNTLRDSIQWSKVQAHFNANQLRKSGYKWKDLDSGQKEFIQAKYGKDVASKFDDVNTALTPVKGWKAATRSSGTSYWGANTIKSEWFVDKNLGDWVSINFPYYVRAYPGVKRTILLTGLIGAYAYRIAMVSAEALWDYITGNPNSWIGYHREADFRKMMNNDSVTKIFKEVCIEKLKDEFFGELPKGYGEGKTEKDENGNVTKVHFEKSFSEDKKCFLTDEEFTLTNGVVVKGMKTKLEKCIEAERESLLQKFWDPKSIISEKGRNQIEEGGWLSAFSNMLDGKKMTTEELIAIIKNTPEFVISTVEEMDEKIIEAGDEAKEKIKNIQDKVHNGGKEAGEQGGWGKVGN